MEIQVRGVGYMVTGYMLFSIYFKLYPDIDRYWPDQDPGIPCVQWQYDMEI